MQHREDRTAFFMVWLHERYGVQQSSSCRVVSATELRIESQSSLALNVTPLPRVQVLFLITYVLYLLHTLL